MARRRPEVVFHLAAQADVRVSVRAAGLRRRGQHPRHACGCSRGPGRRARPRVVFAASGGTLYGESDPSELPVQGVASAPAALALRRVQEGGHRLPRRLPGAARPRVLRPGAGQRLRAPPGPPRRGRRGGHLRRPAAARRAGARSSATASRPATSSTSTTSSTPSSGPPTRGGGLVLNIGTGREISVNELARVMGERAGVARPRPCTPRPGRASSSAARLDPERAGIHLGWRAWTDARRRACDGVLDSPGASRSLSRRAGEPGQRKRSSAGGRTISSATDPRRSQAGSTPRTTATGTRAGLAHDELGGRRDLVGHAHLGGLQLPAQGVGGAPQVDDGGHAGAADGHVGRRPGARPGRRCRTRSTADLDARWRPAGRRGCGGPSGRSPRGAGPPSRARRWRGRRRRWRRRSRGGSR